MDDKEPAIDLSEPTPRAVPEVATAVGIREGSGSPANRRRAQRRQATYDEMMSRARAALEEGRPLSLRAIASEMGLTAPALYRYVDSHAALQSALAEAVLDDVVGILEAAAATEEHAGAGLVAAMVAFRQWALDRPHEFRLLCSAHDEGYLESCDEAGSEGEGREPTWAIRLAIRFMPRVEDLYRAGVITPPTEEDLPPGAAEAIRNSLPRWFPDGDIPDVPVGLWWAGVRHWATLCGTVGVEVHRLVGPSFRDGALFHEALRSTCAHLGVPTDDDKVLQALEDRIRDSRSA